MNDINTKILSYKVNARQWWQAPLIPTLWRQSQVNLCEFTASLVCRESSRTETQRNPVSKRKKERKRKRKRKERREGGRSHSIT